MNMGQWQNESDKEKPKSSEKNLSRFHKSHTITHKIKFQSGLISENFYFILRENDVIKE